MEKRGQVWVETVTYTLVAFILIGLILAFVKPKIDQLQDEALIKQSMNAMNKIDSVVNEVYQQGAGNKRLVDLYLKKGNLMINPVNDTIIFTYPGTFKYSEPGVTIPEGSFSVTTTKFGPKYIVTIEKEYKNFNITFENKMQGKNLTGAADPYQIYIENKGGVNNTIDFSLK